MEKPVSIVFSSSEISLPVSIKRGGRRIAVGARVCLRLAKTKKCLRVISVGEVECH